MDKFVEKAALILMVVAVLVASACYKLFGIIGIMIGLGVLITGLMVIAIRIKATITLQGNTIPLPSDPPNGGA